MIIVMQSQATDAEIEAVQNRIIELGYKPHLIRGVERTVIGCVGREDKSPLQGIETMNGVESAIPILKPYKLVGREFKPENSVLNIGGVEVGGKRIVVMAGPCSVESREQILEVAHAVKAAGAQFLRGGAYKPRTSPYAFQGLGEEGLEYLAQARDETGLKIVTEVVNVNDIEKVAKYSDVLQIGA
ncbi:3-deoxy-7-phosphoheptulonate synthase, partial [Candidatus Sumerlaeota bacterium]|nr:3-deoxy-7-phosphoheptulonate synthase [Candidatus Sumerlaeota bacterium]